MKSILTAALICIYGIAWAQVAPSTPVTPNTATSQKDTVDRLREENLMTQEQTQQSLRKQNGRGVVPRSRSVCIHNDKRCLSEEARSRINQNNGTVKDNPTDLNNRPTY